jgi:hypothetical protein
MKFSDKVFLVQQLHNVQHAAHYTAFQGDAFAVRQQHNVINVLGTLKLLITYLYTQTDDASGNISDLY